MKKENRILLAALAVFVLLIIVSFNNDGITGLAISDVSVTKLEVSPKVVSVGDNVFISVYPGKDGVNEKVSFYQAEDNLRKYSVNEICNNYVCFKDASFSFYVPSSWEYGVYYIQVYDYGIKDFVRVEFTIKN